MVTKGPDGRSSVYRSDDGRWHGWVTLGTDPATGRRRRRHVQAATKAAVTAKVADLERQREAGGAMSSSRRLTVSEWVGMWLGDRCPPVHDQGLQARCAPTGSRPRIPPARPGDPCRHRKALPESPGRRPVAGDRCPPGAHRLSLFPRRRTCRAPGSQPDAQGPDPVRPGTRSGATVVRRGPGGARRRPGHPQRCPLVCRSRRRITPG